MASDRPCTVCGFAEAGFWPGDYNICACCGTEFGASDCVLSVVELRLRWVSHGCPWFDQDEPQPEGWSRWRNYVMRKLNCLNYA